MTAARAVRPPAVAGSFYPGDSRRLADLVTGLLADAARFEHDPIGPGALRGVLVPHAGLAYSGLIAAAAWRLVGERAGPGGHGQGGEPGTPASGQTPGERPTVVLLGTNHGAAWLDGVGVWASGVWRTPLGDVEIDERLAAAILALGEPFIPDAPAHLGEHSIEVQLPFVQLERPLARIVPLAVAAGNGAAAVAAGERLGRLLAARRAAGDEVILAISTDMAHYPPHDVAERVTKTLLPAICDLDPATLARGERFVRQAGMPGVVCGMCGIEPAVLGLAALRAFGASRGILVAAGTSADSLGPPERTVGYLAVAFAG